MTSPRDISAPKVAFRTVAGDLPHVSKVRRVVRWAARHGAVAALAALGIVIAGEAQAMRSLAGSVHNTPTIVRRSPVPGLHRDHFAWAVAPVVAFVAVCGDASAPAYSGFGYRVDWDTTTLGDSGRKDQTYHEWRVRVSGAAPSSRISVIDPINGATRYLDADQHGAFLYYLPIDAGTYTVEHRMFNSSGLYSGWNTVATVTRTARDTGKYVYYDPAIGSSGDGLSWANAKKTNAEAVTLANSLGAGATVWCRSGTVAGDGGRVTVDDVLFLPDPDAGTVTHTISSNVDFISGGVDTDGVTVVGMTFTGTNGRIFNSDVDGPKNVAIYNCSYGGIQDVASSSGNSRVMGVAFINLTETASLTAGQTYFGNDTEGFLAFGVYSPIGSDGEHNYRLQNVPTSTLSGFHCFAYCTSGCATTKTGLRWLADQDLWCYGCDFRRTVYVGFLSPGGTSENGGGYQFMRCKFTRYSGQATDFTVTVFSGWNQGSFSNCFFDRISLFFNPQDSEAATDYTVDNTILQCTFYYESATAVAVRYNTSLTNNPTNQVYRGNAFIDASLGTTAGWIEFKDISSVVGYDFSYNHFDRSSDTHVVAEDQATSGATREITYTEFVALGFVTGTTRATTTIDATTLEPSAGLTTVTPAAPFPHVSYYAGNRYDYAASTYPAGAWLDPADAGEYPEFLYYNIGNLLLKVVA